MRSSIFVLTTLLATAFAAPTVPSSDAAQANLPTLNAVQSKHARTIAAVAKQRKLPIRACEVAIATALVESSVLVYANSNVPSSYNYPHDAVGSDHQSVGIFQQQPQFWGTVKDCMDPATSAGKFYAALVKVGNWQKIPIGTAAQDVQRSAYPDRYQQRAAQATTICKAAF